MGWSLNRHQRVIFSDSGLTKTSREVCDTSQNEIPSIIVPNIEHTHQGRASIQLRISILLTPNRDAACGCACLIATDSRVDSFVGVSSLMTLEAGSNTWQEQSP